MKRSATFSECGTFRYTLTRIWDEELPRLLWVLLNSSTADAEKDDPTNRKGIGFSRRWGYGSCVFVNLNAFCSPHPKVMKAQEDPVGPDNDAHILEQANLADAVVCAWGTDGKHGGRDAEVLRLLRPRDLLCLGTTKHGHPKHPLYLSYDTPLEAFAGKGPRRVNF